MNRTVKIYNDNKNGHLRTYPVLNTHHASASVPEEIYRYIFDRNTRMMGTAVYSSGNEASFNVASCARRLSAVATEQEYQLDCSQ